MEEKKVTHKKDGTPRKIRTNYERRLNTVPRSDIGSKREPAKEGDKRLGNTYCMNKETFGKPKLFKKPEILWDYAMDYIGWCADHPIKTNELMRGGIAAGTVVAVEKPKALSMRGFAIYLGIASRTLSNYGSHEDYKEFHNVYNMLSDIFDEQKVTEALVGNLDPRLAASIMGIRETQELKIMPVLNFDKDDSNA